MLQRPRCGALGGILATCALLLLVVAGGAEGQCEMPATGQPEWIDPATTACTFSVCTDNNITNCLNKKVAPTQMQLVFSDEFTDEGRNFSAAADHPKWTAHDMWYDATRDYEVYKPDQVTTRGGHAVITMDEGETAAPVQRGNGSVWNVTRKYKSGFFDSWNKFCYTGGYLEAELQFPGDNYVSGFWPAFWLMGNLGRAGYLKATKGIWPHTYDTCGGGDAATERDDAVAKQMLSACEDTDGFDRTMYGMEPLRGRGAPEIDMVEVKVSSSINEKKPIDDPDLLQKYGIQRYERYDPGSQEEVLTSECWKKNLNGTCAKNGSKPKALNSMTMQVGPFLPNGTSWNVVDNPGGPDGPGPLGPGMFLPSWHWDGTKVVQKNNSIYTHTTYWNNDAGFSYGMLKYFEANWRQYHATDKGLAKEAFLNLIRPGSPIQDSISVFAALEPSFFNNNTDNSTVFHKFGLDWKPGEYSRWYVDGQLVYEVNKEAMKGQSNGTFEVFDRLVPVEAMYIIFNFAMSNGFTKVDIDRLVFPSWYKINSVRVYQDPAAINLGCSPKDYPTDQWLACNRDTYIIQPQDQALIKSKCTNFTTCRSEWGVNYEGGNLWFKNGTQVVHVNVTNPQDCCTYCGGVPECGGYTWDPYILNGTGTCFLKASEWTRMPATGPETEGYISGIAYDKDSDVSRLDNAGLSTRSVSAAPAVRAGAAAWLFGLVAAVILLLL